ncbi:MAG TPA: SPFH domain-containing protein [Vicinamibacterales bacterium]|nr:SPFH domain-containing protein [Vicinamibacterales bacterium]
MLFAKYVLFTGAFSAFTAAAALLAHDAWRVFQLKLPVTNRWRAAGRLAAIGCMVLLAGLAIVVVPSGKGGVRVSQVSGTLNGTLYPGTHVVAPLVHRVELFNIRDQILNTSAFEPEKGSKEPEALTVYSKEGLPVGVGVSVRYQLDPRRLAAMEKTLPQPVETELMPPVVANAFRQTVANYMVRDVFSEKREEVRRIAAETITKRLAADGIVVKEVMLREIALPDEYAKGLEGLLVKAQENDRMAIELEVKQKLVRTAELEAEAQKTREVKAAEGRAQITVLEAKAQADAMQHTLPLKEKQIQQTRLEAEARKESTVKGAEAAAQAKVIDSKAELEKRNLMAQAEAQRIQLLAGADAVRLKSEASVLKDNPLLIQKIIAERLSDKVQIMMVPADGRFFFANDVLKGGSSAANAISLIPNER